jgi:glycosyltransferase involved in cell wall biosynthesis
VSPGPGMPSQPPATSVIVCAYTERRFADLVAAIRSVERQGTRPAEVVVVVDHNPELLARARSELDAVVVPSTGPQGLSGARNTGIAASRGAVLAFLDDDAAAAPDWLGHLLAPYADPRVMGVGGAIEPDWAECRPPFMPDEFDWVVGCTYRGMPTVRCAVRNLIGANMSLRREVFDAVGGFRTDVGRVGTRPLGCEETELCIRARRVLRGGELIFEPRARVRHRVPSERAAWRYFRSRCWSEGRSKAVVARHSGADDALSTERRYVTSTLPRGVARGVGAAVTRGDAGGLARAGAIVAGLTITTAGYAAGTIHGRLA